MAGSIERLRKGMLTLLVLEALSERPLYLYQIIKLIEKNTRGHYRPSTGSLYPVLRRLLHQGAIKIIERDHKKFYEITEEGRKMLESLKAEREEFRKEFVEGPKREILDKLVEIGLLLKENRKKIQGDKTLKIVEILNDCERKIKEVLSSS